MASLHRTNAQSWAPLFARLAVFLTIFPHGAQKLLGWFGGSGYTATMGFLTSGAGLPTIIALLVILIEFFGPLFLLVGAFSRLAALAVLINFLGVIFKVTIHNGFFMNWSSEAGKGEGLEYFVLLFALLIILMITGGGKASIDGCYLTKKTTK